MLRVNIAAAYVRRLFADDERVAILAVARRPPTRGIIQRFPTAALAASDKYQAWCRYLNAQGYDVYLGVNPVKGHRRRREKQDMAEVRRLQLDLDEAGPTRLRELLGDVAVGQVPRPAGIMFSSFHRYQVLWDTQRGKWLPAAAEGMMRALADRYGGDRAVADVARVMRVPGLRNKKRGRADARIVWVELAGRPVVERDFAFVAKAVGSGLSPAARKGQRAQATPRGGSRSEQDWAYVREQLRAGTPASVLIARLAERRQDKPKPMYYAERTVTRAAISLSMEVGS